MPENPDAMQKFDKDVKKAARWAAFFILYRDYIFFL